MVLWNRTPFSPLAPGLLGLQGQAEALMGLLAVPAASQRGPALNLHGTEEELSLTAPLPGYGPDDLDIEIEGGLLRLSSREGSERAAFRRSLRLPYRVDPDSVEASLVHGELHVTARRLAADAPRSIPVRTEQA